LEQQTASGFEPRKSPVQARSTASVDAILKATVQVLLKVGSRIGCPPEIPVTGERKNVRILRAIELWRTRFDYRQETVFNATTYLGFLEQLAPRYRRQGAILIQDNASYHKDAEVLAWFKSNRHWLEVHQLPPYLPELNPTERLWQHTRKNGTHNRFFGCVDALLATLTGVFGEMQSHPELIRQHRNSREANHRPRPGHSSK
jgi:transposase